MLDQSTFTIPVRILKDPGLPTWAQNVIPVAIGIFIGVLADRLKSWLALKSDLNLAKQEIYDELASFIADLQGDAPDYASYRRFRTTGPKLDTINWYAEHRLELLLRLDRKKGIRMLIAELKALPERRDEQGVIKDQGYFIPFIQNRQHTLDSKYLAKRVYVARKLTESINRPRGPNHPELSSRRRILTPIESAPL